MASIIKRNNNFCVVYSYKDADGTPKQKWETFTDLSDAKNRKKEVEYKESVGTFVVPQCKTLNDLLPEYVALYGKSKWALSTYQANTALIANYIAPLIGSMKLQDISTRVIEGYYQRLLKYEAADPMCGKRKHQFVSPSTVQVLKSPKTDSSIRTIFLPKTVAEMLVEFKAEQDMTKEALGAEYTDYNLVVAGPLGMPTEQSTINGALKRLIEKNNLPKVVFHSFRHSSITYKLKLNGGDIKAVQGDSGHAQASMVTEQYAHILDDDRRLNAQRFDDFFYRHQGAEPEMPHQTAQPIPENSAVDADAAAALTKLLANPSMAELIKNLAKNL